MSVLRLKIVTEELDDVLREIEIVSKQNFKDLHLAILKFFDIKSSKNATFFISNRKWQKLNEITLGEQSRFEDAIDGLTTAIDKVLKGSTNRLIYFNEGVPQFTFLLVLQSSEAASKEEMVNLPRCVKKAGNLPTMASSFTDDIFDDNIKLHIDNILEDPDDEYY